VASLDHIKALLRSHAEGDEDRFFAVAMQLAAHEAKLGHGAAAEEIRSLIDNAKRRRGTSQPVQIGKPRGELTHILSASWPKSRLSDIVVSPELGLQIQRVIREQRHAERILEFGLSPRRKLLLVGPPGTGKTLTASVLAGELGLPLFVVRLDALITKFMGETASKLRLIFDSTVQTRGIYFFDEFDAIGSQRGSANDVGEISRVLNSFLHMIENDQSHSLIVAATNHPEILDRALFRRFDDVLHYDLPAADDIVELLKTRVAKLAEKRFSWRRLAELAKGLSHADVTRAAEEAVKDALIHEREKVCESEVARMLKERSDASHRLWTRT
jgi:SpoVK/Ycf46/Vps4 family AAA+-type ATPase